MGLGEGLPKSEELGSCRVDKVSLLLRALHTGHPYRSVHSQALFCGLCTLDMVRGYLAPGTQLSATYKLDMGVGRGSEGGGHRGPCQCHAELVWLQTAPSGQTEGAAKRLNWAASLPGSGFPHSH